MAISPVLSVIVPATANSMLSPAPAAATAPRSEPPPESPVFVTVTTAACAAPSPSTAASPVQKRRRKIAGMKVGRVGRIFIAPEFLPVPRETLRGSAKKSFQRPGGRITFLAHATYSSSDTAGSRGGRRRS